jgi:putative transposase
VINSAILSRLNEIFKDTLEKWDSQLVELNGEPDHVHLLISYPPQTQLSKLIANLKTVSSRLIRKEFSTQVNKFYYKPVFWTGAYFVASCGGVTVEQLKRYVENQRMSNTDFFLWSRFMRGVASGRSDAGAKRRGSEDFPRRLYAPSPTKLLSSL